MVKSFLFEVLKAFLEQLNLVLVVGYLILVGFYLFALDFQILNCFILVHHFLFQVLNLQDLVLNELYRLLFSFVVALY